MYGMTDWYRCAILSGKEVFGNWGLRWTDTGADNREGHDLAEVFGAKQSCLTTDRLIERRVTHVEGDNYNRDVGVSLCRSSKIVGIVGIVTKMDKITSVKAHVSDLYDLVKFGHQISNIFDFKVRLLVFANMNSLVGFVNGCFRVALYDNTFINGDM